MINLFDNLVEFDSPIKNMVIFDDKLLVLLEDGTYHLSIDGKYFKEFRFISTVEYEVLNKK